MEQRLEPNSNKYKEEKKKAEEREKIEKVVTGTVKTKKKSGVSKFISNFISEDLSDIKTYIIKDAIIPSVKRAIDDVVHMALWGGERRKPGINADKVSYRSYYNDRTRYDEPRSRELAPARTTFNYDEIVFDNYAEADAVLSSLDEAIDRYGSARVADLYDACGLSCPYTANKYGWRNISTAKIERSRDGYWLNMPKPSVI